ncbi:hypothetical protein Aau02nite_59500 [Amorphoplanes auranticolor]|uniref:MFS transporter n=1 Tax=Actinoplanes auranticolor TaxID=47988 RepID=A0A919SLW3_9ACTN|nr:hypothetical protein [Actinoplanes auranticolor]GIM74144.1 hypothetical protein Aau02nite_59500 [Actinoplanes auranticolor]
MVWSGVVIAVAALLLAIWPTWPVALAASVLLGAGYGVYLAVDTALITQVLPAAVDRARIWGSSTSRRRRRRCSGRRSRRRWSPTWAATPRCTR